MVLLETLQLDKTRPQPDQTRMVLWGTAAAYASTGNPRRCMAAAAAATTRNDLLSIMTVQCEYFSL